VFFDDEAKLVRPVVMPQQHGMHGRAFNHQDNEAFCARHRTEGREFI
jgi:hypothetical protein